MKTRTKRKPAPKGRRGILEFDLPEEEEQFKTACIAMDYYCAVWDIRQAIRAHKKYGVSLQETLEKIEEALTDIPY